MKDSLNSMKSQNDEFCHKINEQDETIEKFKKDLNTRILEYVALENVNKEIINNLYCL